MQQRSAISMIAARLVYESYDSCASGSGSYCRYVIKARSYYPVAFSSFSPLHINTWYHVCSPVTTRRRHHASITPCGPIYYCYYYYYYSSICCLVLTGHAAHGTKHTTVVRGIGVLQNQRLTMQPNAHQKHKPTHHR